MTTAKEAVENFNEAADKYTDTLKKKAPEIVRSLAGTFCDMKIRLMLNFAADATEKQIPKKPYFEGDGYADGVLVYDRAICPACGNGDFEFGINNWGCKFCPDCGQALDWSDTE